MRTLPLDFYKRLDALLESGVLTWVVAIELTTGVAFYLTTSNEPVRHLSITWVPFPMKLGNFEDSGTGDLPSSTLSLTNVGRIPMQYLEGSGWDQAIVIEKLVLTAEPTVDIGLRFDYVVQAAVATAKTVTLHLSQPNFFQRSYPPQRFLRSEQFPGISRNVN